jgi:ABC-type polar amino acid transport system ATPase subunit
LLLDEITSALDPELVGEVLALVGSWRPVEAR